MRFNSGLGMAALAAALLSGSPMALRPDEPRVREVRHVIGGKKQERRNRKRLYMKLKRTQSMGRSKRLKYRDTFGQCIERLTNHQRNQWARSGYPGLRKRNVAEFQAYQSV